MAEFQSDVNLEQIVKISLAGILLLVDWIREHKARTGEMPTNEEVLARVRGKLNSADVEGLDALAEFPEGS